MLVYQRVYLQMAFDIYKPTLNCKERGPSYVWFINSSRYGSSTIKPTFLQMNFAKDWGHIGSRSSFWGDLFQSQQAWKVTSRRLRLSPLPDYASFLNHSECSNYNFALVSSLPTSINQHEYQPISISINHFHSFSTSIRSNYTALSQQPSKNNRNHLFKKERYVHKHRNKHEYNYKHLFKT